MVSGIQTLKKISHKARSLVKKRQAEEDNDKVYLQIIITAIAGAAYLGYINISDVKKQLNQILNTLKNSGKVLTQEQIKAALQDNLTPEQEDALKKLTQAEKDAIKA